MKRMTSVQLKSVNLRPVRAEGFTLIEIVTVVAIVAILAAIAIPSYTQFLARGYRSEARATLVAAAQWMERWRTERGTLPGWRQSACASGGA